MLSGVLVCCPEENKVERRQTGLQVQWGLYRFPLKMAPIWILGLLTKQAKGDGNRKHTSCPWVNEMMVRGANHISIFWTHTHIL